MPLSPFELEIFRNILSSIAEEMGMVLVRAGFSPNIKERRDLSCAVFGSNGDMIAQAAHIPVHLGSMSFSVKSVLEEPDIQEGDVFILNDPFKGGTHLPDVTCIAPVVIDKKIEFFVASRAHHADIGGRTPGSMPLSTSIHEEGIIIPPSRLFKKGRLNNRLFNKILSSTRDAEEREGDFRAQVGALHLGIERLREVVKKYSLRKIKDAGRELLNYSERIMRRVIKEIPDGVYKFEDYLDNDGVGTKKIIIKASVEIHGASVRVDFAGSSPQVKGSINVPLSVTTAAVLYVFQCLAPSDLPLNSGPLRSITIKANKGSILNSKFPAAVSAGNVETSQRIVDVVFGALSKAIPHKIQAASSGTMNNFTFGGINPKTGKDFAYYETIAGGMGGRFGKNGASAVQTHMTNTLNTPIEALERELPIMIDEYSIRKRSGGQGTYKGGNGIVREYKFLSKATVSLITDRRELPPYGIRGGKPGKRGKNILIRNHKSQVLPPKVTFRVRNRDVLRIETPGGGGWGKKIQK
ncbi:hydantoinase B/oxoprolinase family protein [Desulfobacterota bacterium AH_259_B03_O07]|nr:hydantoinase B/oxoprolinase family protein [Desulfobacterota bacterium AH_259_B03_O07]